MLSQDRSERLEAIEIERALRAKREFEQEAAKKRLVYEGATVDELVKMFRAQPSDVRVAVATLPKIGERNSIPVYNIRDAAVRILPPGDNVIARVLKMKHTDLPKMLSKEYWQAQLNMQTFQERAGDLWRTVDVIEVASDAFKTIRMSVLLLRDTVDRESSLDDQQRRIIQRLLDSMLADMKRKLIDALNGRKRSNNSAGEPQSPENDDPAWDL